MKTTHILLLISLAFYLWYVISAIVKTGLNTSISDNYRHFPIKNDWKRDFYYWLFIIGITIPLTISAILNCTKEWQVLLALFTGFLLLIDCAAPSVSSVVSKAQAFFHSFGADMGILGGMCMLIFIFHQYLLVATFIFGAILLLIFKPKNKKDEHIHTHLIEDLAYFIIFTGIWTT
jgi:hypothetical protein